MPTQRTLVLLEPPIRNTLKQMAQSTGNSISGVCRDLIREALEIYEDKYWDKLATEREKNFNWKKALTHAEVWNALPKKTKR